MGIRYHKSIGLGKFIRMNISKSGIGFSFGVPGLRISTGPSGTNFTAGLPGTGLSYRKKVSSRSRRPAKPAPVEAQAAEAAPPAPAEIPSPSLFAPQHEKELAEGLEAYQADRLSEALDHFLNAANEEPGAAILAAALLAEQTGGQDQAIRMLERVIQSDEEFPTRLMKKYLADTDINIEITPSVAAPIAVVGPAAALLLAELYQSKGRLEEAIGLLEELEELAPEPLLILSLCELYLIRQIWDGLIDRAKQVEIEDDVTLAINILYGRAMQGKALHEAAIEVFSQALREKERSPQLLKEARYWRALSYEALGRQSQANRELQKLYADDPEFWDVVERLEKSRLN